jgi:hypothetical protein
MFGRIAKVTARGEIFFTQIAVPDEAAVQRAEKEVEAWNNFKGWVTDVFETSTLEEITDKVKKLNDEEHARQKSAKDHVDIALYHVGRSLRTAKAALDSQQIAFDELMKLVIAEREQSERTMQTMAAEIDRLRIECGEPPVEGWEKWATYQVAIEDPKLGERINRALGL